MINRVAPNVPVPPWGIAIAAMLCVQLGSVLSVDPIADGRPAGAAWLQLSIGSLIYLLPVRPFSQRCSRSDG